MKSLLIGFLLLTTTACFNSSASPSDKSVKGLKAAASQYYNGFFQGNLDDIKEVTTSKCGEPPSEKEFKEALPRYESELRDITGNTKIKLSEIYVADVKATTTKVAGKQAGNVIYTMAGKGLTPSQSDKLQKQFKKSSLDFVYVDGRWKTTCGGEDLTAK